ncbi:MAG: hypothetical protein VX294_08765 [Candidatus Latescibacterota bacterium]|nr:hypothetical protein [Candidatus Latescibacterota bacterium]
MNFTKINLDVLRDFLIKLNPRVLFSIGAFCIVVALGGLIVVWTEDPSPVTPISHDDASLEGDEVVFVETAELDDELSEDELRREVVQMILGRIEHTRDLIDEDWFKEAHQLIKNKADLNLFLDEYFVLGAKRKASYERRQKVVNKPALEDPLYFDSMAASALVDSDASEKGLLRGVRENLAYALLLMKEDRGIDAISPHFMVGFFNKLHAMYEILERRSVEKNINSDYWTQERIRHIEAAIVTRFQMLEENLEKTRARVEGTQQSGAAGLLNKDRLETAINEYLLELGKTHRDAAMREGIDRKKHQLHVDYAFVTLAMIYKRSYSGDALNVLRSVNDLERNYTYRLARRHWKRAQLAVMEGDSLVVKENFFSATKFYLRSISRSVHTERTKLERELSILKSEIAQWKYKSADANEI